MKFKIKSSYVLSAFIALCGCVLSASAQTAGGGDKPNTSNQSLVRVQPAQKQEGERKPVTDAKELQLAKPRPVTGQNNATAEVPRTAVRRKRP